MEQKNKKKKKKLKISKRLIKHKLFRKRNLLSLLTMIISITFLCFLKRLDILPTKYIIGISIIIILMNIIGTLFINVHKKTPLKVIGTIILCIILGTNIIGIYYLAATQNFIEESFKLKTSYSKTTYYVLSKTSKNLQEKDITGEIATYKEISNRINAINKLNEKYPVKEKEYEDIGTMFENLTNETDSFALVEKASYEILFSITNTYQKADYTILYEFDIFTKKDQNKMARTDKFNVFIGGTDFAGLMDLNMIATINSKTHTVLLTSIPRDYYIEVPDKDGRKDKLSFMNAYGPDSNRKALEALFDTQIDYSVTVNSDSLVTVVDYIGGIEFCSDYDFTTTHALVNNSFVDYGKKLTIHKGCQTLNGIETLTVARERNAFPGRDRVRQQNCQKIMIAIFKKLISTDTILHYNETLNTLDSLYETDVPKEIITSTIKDILNNGNNWNIQTQSVNGVDTFEKVHLSNLTDWVMIPDDTVIQAKEEIKKTLN